MSQTFKEKKWKEWNSLKCLKPNLLLTGVELEERLGLAQPRLEVLEVVPERLPGPAVRGVSPASAVSAGHDGRL